MENQLAICNKRLKNVLVNDKKDNPSKIINVLKSDLLYVLKNYMDIKSEDLDLIINVTENGTYKIELMALVKRIKTLNYIS